MQIGIIIQARMGSTRLPGKVLMPLAEKPLLQHLLDRLQQCHPPLPLVIATSTDPVDTPLAAYAETQGLPCHRGGLDDVAGRFVGVLDQVGWTAFVRVSGDSPLLDHRLVERAVQRFRKGAFDLVTNVFPRTFPPGQSVEVVRTDTFRKAYTRFEGAQDHEHVTRHFYHYHQRYRIENLAAVPPYVGIDFAVDTPEDHARVAALMARMTPPFHHYDVTRMVQLVRQSAAGAAQ